MAEKKVGRPTKYNQDQLRIATMLYRKGCTDEEVAEALGIAASTIYCWTEKHEAFSESRKGAKDHADAQVERCLFEKATGYAHEAVKIFCNKDGDVTKVPYTEKFAPDTTAMIYWLKNRKPKTWRDRQEVALTGLDELAQRMQEAQKRANGREDG